MARAREKALKTMLRPIVRFWLRGSDTLQSFVDVLKVTFVEIAVEEILRGGEKVNVSRINMMTGVHRLDAAKIYKKGQVPDRALPDIVTRVLSTWEQDPDFQTKTGKTKTLSYEGPDSDFAQLVEKVCRGINPGTVLFELERAESVVISSKGARLLRPTHRRSKDLERSVAMLGRDIETLIRAVDENIASDAETSPHLHARTEYDRVYVSDIPKIRDWLWKEGRKFHKKVRDYVSKHDKDFVDRPGEEATGRVSITAFSFSEEQAPLIWSADKAK